MLGLTDDGFSQRYVDTIALFNYGYNNYSLKKAYSKGDIVQTIKVKHATKATKQLDVAVQNDVNVLVQTASTSPLLPNIQIKEDLKAPITQGDIVGTVTYSVDEITYTENLIASKDVKASKLEIKILIFVFILVLILCYLRIKKIKNKNRRLRNKKRLQKRY